MVASSSIFVNVDIYQEIQADNQDIRWPNIIIYHLPVKDDIYQGKGVNTESKALLFTFLRTSRDI